MSIEHIETHMFPYAQPEFSIAQPQNVAHFCYILYYLRIGGYTYMKRLGELLIALRKMNGLSQKNMADILGVSVSAISKWENCQNYPDIELIPQIAELFNVSCDELLHPETMLEKLNLLQDEGEISCDKGCDSLLSKGTVTKNMFFQFRWYIALALVAVCVIYIYPSCVEYYKQHTFRLVDTNKYVMTDWGLTYELVFYHPYKSTDGEMLAHADQIEELWQNGYYTDSTEEFLMVTYYLSEDDINSNQNVFFQAVYLLDDVR